MQEQETVVETHEEWAKRKKREGMVVTMRQARLALMQFGLLADVEPAIEALAEPDRSAARIEWEYSQTVERNTAFVDVLSQELGLGENELDELFALAKTL